MKPTSSPWGKIDSCERFSSFENTYAVGTPSHGGLMIPLAEAAKLNISEYGEQHRTKSATWLCFEEDCQVSVAILSLILNKYLPFDDQKVKDSLTSIKHWNNQFLATLNLSEYGDIGDKVKAVIESIKETLDKIDKVRAIRETREKMRAEKNSNLIVSACGVSNYSDLTRFLKSLPRDIQDQEDLAKNREILRSLQKEVEFYDKDEDALFNKPGVVIVWTADEKSYLVRNYDSSRELNLLSSCEKIGSFI
jgi:hypothetical protein